MSASQSSISYFLPDEAATQRFGEDFALALQKGDLVTLSGDLGAGKSSLARAIIRAIADDEGLDVPSPTFTLVQSYEALRIAVAHADLYRISHGEELDELGLPEFLEDGVVLAEWPEQGEGFLSEPSFAVTLSHEGAGRRISVSGPVAAIQRLERSHAIRAFLDLHGRADATRRYLQGDASPRKYETIRTAAHGVEILMNAPQMPYDPPLRDGKTYRQIAHLAENILAFAAINGLLAGQDFRVPQMRAANLDAGFLILENLGTEGVRASSGEPVAERYEAAGRFLAHLHGVSWPGHAPVAGHPDHIIAGFDRDAMMIEVSLIGQWYAPRMMGRQLTDAEKQAYEAAWDHVIADIADVEKSLLLRDYHSPNLFWFPEAEGKDKIGVIDFQDAMIGPAAYDVASLALDARVTISPELEQAVVAAYCDERCALGHAFDEALFRKAYAAMGAQRNAKLLGLFVRLDERDGKPDYLKHLPRIHDYLGRVLKHSVMAPVAAWFEELGLMQQEEAAQ
ncbi:MULTISPECIES: tRNA (adenosine(37)-N6)-threonylcarbamoyltransferase complex ATPase subunit type 1 TsaE [Brucella/Ochrobactrum group]|uniref:tRNA threonylcarbamoyladenosine biosynthesis protein TsaE n=1 Tax=Brucella lupini TaxID=255457 RepID=A0A256GR81_9HYPH|nr:MULTISPECIES: tRNA (adenosine(37)-N6)-threonylcarbamoyltransferase complex ATPase subunit type 1 TsaE [Brucella/Ochrobactrum group]RNL45464.1 tRNA (adenosine(37)-N6)-threonylcarbamoyltransferase complex ATPase subunit type 1 TsaE [Ochrobactrum sp. MH181795]AIK45362.1 tRNA threonylcarbamoyl adenosine modification protein YjeE [Brucella anthropi]KAB2705553.1 tRNA (adenosine(37)-N6)-threonylcarbamoyltransferase complex ATPase subunit type 1 TsaE [Brucella lupini]KAB2726700.1 tRNA (adenosine(37)